MTIDLTQFHEAFYDESAEAIAQMEEALLQLDVGTPDAQLIGTIFRVAHSIKGGAATFGFGEIASFTHSLETLLDELRGGRMQVTTSLSDLLLRSVDVLREMLRAQQGSRPIDAQRVADLQFDLEVAVARSSAAATAPAATAPVATPPAAAPPALVTAAAPSSGAAAAHVLPPAVAHEQLYQIGFRPFLHLLARGNDPLRIFRELRELGELQVSAQLSALPPLQELDPENCYLSWTLQLRTEAQRQAIVEVFDWAEGDCDLDIKLLQLESRATPPAPAAVAGEAETTAADEAGMRAADETGARVANETGTRVANEAETRAARSGEGARAGDASSIRVSTEKIDELMNSVGELVITQSMLGQFGGLLDGAMGERLRSALSQLERNVRELQESVMRVRMVPISFVFSRFPRMVRDLSQRLGKQVELQMTGGDTELDKTVLEKIGDPLVHLVRNSIDHGIESPEQRQASGKHPRGQLRLHACQRGSSITVQVSDDGGGLKRERILAKARERSLIGADERLADEAVCNLIFLPGFSTVEQATEISGRGVGMDVVKRNVEELGGSIEVRSEPGVGSRFSITLPLTLAIVDGQTVAVGDESYIVPLTAIIESLQLRTASVSQVVGHGEVLAFRGEYLPVLRLAHLFNSGAGRARDANAGLIMVVEGDGRRVGLCVDELLGQQQVVVKPLDANYGQVEGIAGATILGDGSVALILDIAALTLAVRARRAA